MKKILLISLLLSLFILVIGCGSTYVMSGAVTYETSTKNYYKFAAFKGTYNFNKKIDEDCTIRIVTYTENETVMKLYIKQDGEIVKEMDVTKDTNGTYYIDLKKGEYVFSYKSDTTFKAELTFEWEYDR